MDYTIIYLCLLINDLSLRATLHIRALTTYTGQDQQERVGDWRDGTEWRHTHKRTLGPGVDHHCLACVGPLPHLASPKQAEKKSVNVVLYFQEWLRAGYIKSALGQIPWQWPSKNKRECSNVSMTCNFVAPNIAQDHSQIPENPSKKIVFIQVNYDLSS